MIISWRGRDINISEVSIKEEPIFDSNKELLYTRVTITGFQYDSSADDNSSVDNINKISDTDPVS